MERKPDFVKNPFLQEAAEICSSSQGCCINLNVTVSPWDELSQPSLFSKTDAETLKSSLPRAAVENTTGIDLEAPISLQEDSAHLEVDSLTFQLEITAQVLQHKREDSQANLARLAAETIVDISAATRNNSSMANCGPSSLTESLLWFSEVVSANACDLESLMRIWRGEAEGNDETLDSGDDSFEALTLKQVVSMDGTLNGDDSLLNWG